jgi:hypothetical protein
MVGGEQRWNKKLLTAKDAKKIREGREENLKA